MGGGLMEFDMEKLKVQGIKFNYFYICKRKLWLFSKGISMESNSDRVLEGKVVHESSYMREKRKEILIDDIIRLDIIDGEYVKEVKISSKMNKADKMQLLYYLFYLKQLGIEKKGTLNYVREKKVEEIQLTEESEEEINSSLIEIDKLCKEDTSPKVINMPFCKKCSYYEFCYIKEIDDSDF
jgi:CRISPR-associated exonuclease Cas4